MGDVVVLGVVMVPLSCQFVIFKLSPAETRKFMDSNFSQG